MARRKTKETEDAPGAVTPPESRDPLADGSGGNSFATAADDLLSCVERVEQINREIKEKQEDKKQLRAEIKGKGFSLKTIDIIVRRRARNRDDVDEEKALLDMYEDAIEEAQARR